jgi:integrase
MWYFRIIVPRDLHAVFGKKVIKRSLGTREPGIAKAYAYTLGAQYAQAIAQAREEQRMSNQGQKDRSVVSRFDIKRHDDGNYSVSTNGSSEDNAAALRALEILTAAQPLPQPTVTKPSFTGPTLYQAVEIYGKTEAVGMKPDTWQQRERAFRSFMKAIQPTIRIAHISRPLAAKWAADLQLSGLSKRTVAMMVSHVAQLFDAQIRAGHIERGQNPVKGLVVFKLSDKKAARESGHGWEPFTHDQLKRIFDPENLKRTTKIHVRWGALMGVYTGARVGEIAQLFLRDFEELDGVKCVRLTADSDGQSVKTESSRRLVPLHPDLLELGLWDRVEKLRAQGEERLFPKMRIDSKSGTGNAISKGFSYYIATLGIKPRRAQGTVGFHGLRKSVIQELQGTMLPAERRRALVGHEPGDDVHTGDYMRRWRPEELSLFFPGLPWGDWLDFSGTKHLLSR